MQKMNPKRTDWFIRWYFSLNMAFSFILKMYSRGYKSPHSLNLNWSIFQRSFVVRLLEDLHGIRIERGFLATIKHFTGRPFPVVHFLKNILSCFCCQGNLGISFGSGIE